MHLADDSGVVSWLTSLAHFGQQLVIPLVSVITTVLTVVFTIGAIKKKTVDDLTEATTTWHALSDARKDEISKLQARLAQKDEQLAQKDRRIEFLWAQLSTGQKDNANAKGPTQ